MDIHGDVLLVLGNRTQILRLRPSGPHFTEEPETQTDQLITRQVSSQVEATTWVS